jgi:hypothetical protein
MLFAIAPPLLPETEVVVNLKKRGKAAKCKLPAANNTASCRDKFI